MRVINIIQVVGNNVASVESFGVFEEQLSQDIVGQAEELFKQRAIENGANEDDIELYVEDGTYSNGVDYTVNLVWSDI
jgi:hypothetical protein